MRIVIDLQAAQATNRRRGIGRYSLALARGMIEAAEGHEIILALNGSFADTIEPIRAEFDDILDQDKIRTWSCPADASYLDPANEWRRKSAELIREAFLLNLKPDVVHVSSLFEGLVDGAVTSIGAFSTAVPVAVTLFDLIPYIFPKPYLQNPLVACQYREKLSHLRRADTLLSISESARQDAIKYLGYPTERVVNISGAVDPIFQPQPRDSKTAQQLAGKFGLDQRFVMYTGGIDFRKNIEGLIRAFAALPKSIRDNYQLAIVCSVDPAERQRLMALVQQSGLANNKVVFTGYVADTDLVGLYAICELFCFPSLYEGFGLPVLEAMSCGAPVIASNTSSLPEILGRSDVAFNPFDDHAIAQTMARALSDEGLRNDLRHHGLERSKLFSWQITAKRALKALEERHGAPAPDAGSYTPRPSRRPKLLYVSPLPPQKTGIADYSSELLSELTSYYDVTVILPDPSEVISSNAGFNIQSVAWFYQNANLTDRIIYHFGNSTFHIHMFEMLRRYPGIVVLHDFFLSGIIAHREIHGGEPQVFSQALVLSHGYEALVDQFYGADSKAVWEYPANFEVLQHANGVIVHSEYSRRLAQQFYRQDLCTDWVTIPHLRSPIHDTSRIDARLALELRDDEFVICSFGLLGPIKNNDRLLEAWLASSLSADRRCRLVFVGDLSEGTFRQSFLDRIASCGREDQITITGFVTTEDYRKWLAAADVAVQLRKATRGETSGATLDCMNYGLPTIVNAHGSLGDFSSDCVIKLPDLFEDCELTDALELLWQNESKRHGLSEKGIAVIRRDHAPSLIGLRYRDAIEQFHVKKCQGRTGLIEAIKQIESPFFDQQSLWDAAGNVASSLPLATAQPRLFIDISELVNHDAGSGIQRVVRNILTCLINSLGLDYRIEPVYATVDGAYRYARKFMLRFLDCPSTALDEHLIDVQHGDIFLGLDLQPSVVAAQRAAFKDMRARGAKVYFVVYDLLCIQHPQFFFPGASESLTAWLDVVAQSDGAICISRTVADTVFDHLQKAQCKRLRPFQIGYFHLGADLDSERLCVPAISSPEMLKLANSMTIAMVGTIEPRKGYAQALEAFEQLWASGVDVNLAIVGKPGWMTTELVQRMKEHPERGHRLFLFSEADDQLLTNIYSIAAGFLAASEAEGFGLPLIEAGRAGLPVLARDISVFREVAKSHATYFSGTAATDLAAALERWIAQLRDGSAVRSNDLPLLTWRESTARLLKTFTSDNWYKVYGPNSH